MHDLVSLERLNALSSHDAYAELLQCCGSRKWSSRVAELRPFRTLEELRSAASRVWWGLEAGDWLEAFDSHPRIGEREARVATVGAQTTEVTRNWSAEEQSAAGAAAPDTRQVLADLNRRYEAKYGFIFIVCATGRSSGELIAALRERLANDPCTELRISAQEQLRITELRLRKLVAQ
jgi:OHCU decarboxylase